MAKKWNAAVIWKKKTRTAQSSGFMDFFKKERFLTTGENSTANLFWSLTICGFPHTVTPKTRHIILDAVHAIRNMLLSHRASFFTVKISSPWHINRKRIWWETGFWLHLILNSFWKKSIFPENMEIWFSFICSLVQCILPKKKWHIKGKKFVSRRRY